VYVEIDLSVVVPATVLREPDDVTSFKVVVREAELAGVPVESLERLAGGRAGDPEGRRGLGKMLEYAEHTAGSTTAGCGLTSSCADDGDSCVTEPRDATRL
jgi:hypothetical protein